MQRNTPRYRLHQSGGNAAKKISAVPDWSQCSHCSHPTLLTAVTPAPLQKNTNLITWNRHGLVPPTLQSSSANTDERAWFCRASVSHVVRPFYYYLPPRTRRKGEVSECGRAGGRTTRRTVGQRFTVETLPSDRETAAADWVRSLAVCGCFSPRSRPSPVAPTVGGRTPETKRALRRCLPAR